MDQNVRMLMEAVEYVTNEMAKVPSVDKIALFGSLVVNARKSAKLDFLASVEPVDKEDYWLLEDHDLAFEINREKIRRTSKVRYRKMNDVDIAAWVSSTAQLADIRRALVAGLKEFTARGKFGVSNNEFDVFLLETGTSKYLGRLCQFAVCPKGKEDCLVQGCGNTPFLKRFRNFRFFPDAVNKDKRIDMYDKRGAPAVHSEFDLARLLVTEDKADIIDLIIKLYKNTDSTKRIILSWLTRQSKAPKHESR